LEYGPAVPQCRDAVAEKMFGRSPYPSAEEGCLNLNVWTPGTGGPPRPVMVWIHGGAFLNGSGGDVLYDGSRLAAGHDVVVVTVNYRVGVLGFLHLAGVLGAGHASSGNVGLLDQVAALRWVGENIPAFGGDPDNVTVFGQSAGAMSIVSLITSPVASGLFHRAVVQSGSGELVGSPERAGAVTRELLGVLGLGESGAHRLWEVPVAELIAAEESVIAAMRAGGDDVGLPFTPVVDGVVLPVRPLDAIRAGTVSPVPLLLGANHDEGRLFLLAPGVPSPDAPSSDASSPDASSPGETEVAATVEATYGEGALESFRSAYPGAGPAELAATLTGTRLFLEPTERLAEAYAALTPDVWRYLFTWRSSARDGLLGACHSLELPFVFGNLDRPGVSLLTGPNP
ncbi:carboxylesterase/lipase family protein, partial [Streptosporangium algeriense]